jgi:hypothetical protein
MIKKIFVFPMWFIDEKIVKPKASIKRKKESLEEWSSKVDSVNKYFLLLIEFTIFIIRYLFLMFSSLLVLPTWVLVRVIIKFKPDHPWYEKKFTLEQWYNGATTITILFSMYLWIFPFSIILLLQQISIKGG